MRISIRLLAVTAVTASLVASTGCAGVADAAARRPVILPYLVARTPLPSPTPILNKLKQVSVATQRLASTSVALQQSLLTSLASHRGLTGKQTGFSAEAGPIQQSLLALPYLASATSIRSNTGPGLMAANVYAATGNQAYRASAITVFDQLLRNQRQANGSLFSEPTGGDIDTMFFAANLGIADLLLRSGLDATHRSSWDSAVAGAADYLITNRNLSWYTNGNIVIGNALVEALAYRLTANTKYLTAWQTAWSFATSPNQSRWTGFGLVTTKLGHNADGSDSTGYFAESGNRLGYDPDYTMLQSEQLSRLYLLTRDPSVLRALNMVTNQLLLRVNRSTWLLDASGGSRHNYQLPEPFDSSAIAMLANLGGRTDLAQYAASQLAATTAEFTQAASRLQLGDRGMYAAGAITASTWMSWSPVGMPSSYHNFVAGR